MPPSTRPPGSARSGRVGGAGRATGAGGSGGAGGAGSTTVSIGVVDRSRRRMRRWLRRAWRPIAYLWRRSLMFRSVAITVMTTGLAVGIIGTAVMVSISTNVYSQRRDQIESESARATIVAQGIFDAATAAEDNNQSELETLQNEAQQAILSNTTSPGGTSIAIERSPDQSTPQTLQTIASQDFPDAVITDALRKEVAQNTGRLSLQPVELDDDGRRVPGLAVGSTLQIPSAGQY